MKLSAALESIVKRKTGPRCSVGEFLDRISEADRQEIKEALANPGIRHVLLVEALRITHGVKLQTTTLARHRRGICLCD
jgi:hypothetical protein